METVAPGRSLAHLTLSSPRPARLPEATVRFATPSADLSGHWSPRITVDRVSRWGNLVTSRATTYAPVMAYYDGHEHNRLTFALSDVLKRVDLD